MGLLCRMPTAILDIDLHGYTLIASFINVGMYRVRARRSWAGRVCLSVPHQIRSSRKDQFESLILDQIWAGLLGRSVGIFTLCNLHSACHLFDFKELELMRRAAASLPIHITSPVCMIKSAEFTRDDYRPEQLLLILERSRPAYRV